MEKIQIVRQKLKDIKIKKDEKPFNALNLMYKEVLRKEELQSKIIGGFLNPNENHGYGDVPLTIFLNMILGKDKFKISQNSKFSVELERPVIPLGMPARRIDILLSWEDENAKKHAIIIENKLNWAPNQSNQLNDYHDCIFSEKYDIECIVYMPFSSKHQHSSHTDSRSEVLALTKDFDAAQVVIWLEKIKEYFKDKEIETSSIIQYINFWECLITNNHETIKAMEIIEQLSLEEINKIENLAKLVSSVEWCKARFFKITAKIQDQFNENLVIEYRKWTDGRNYVQYFFRPYEFWVELWLEENEIKLYIVAESDKGESKRINDLTFLKKVVDIYYYYYNKTYFEFDYNDIDGLEKTVISLLKELEKFNNTKDQN